MNILHKKMLRYPHLISPCLGVIRHYVLSSSISLSLVLLVRYRVLLNQVTDHSFKQALDAKC